MVQSTQVLLLTAALASSLVLSAPVLIQPESVGLHSRATLAPRMRKMFNKLVDKTKTVVLEEMTPDNVVTWPSPAKGVDEACEELTKATKESEITKFAKGLRLQSAELNVKRACKENPTHPKCKEPRCQDPSASVESGGHSAPASAASGSQQRPVTHQRRRSLDDNGRRESLEDLD